MRLRNFAQSLGFTYDHMLDLAQTYQQSDEEWPEAAVVEWRFESMWIYEGFWDDYKLVTGREAKHDGAFFSCGGCS